MLAAASFAKCPQVSVSLRGKLHLFNSLATIQIVPWSRSGLLFMPLLHAAFVFPLCLYPSFLPKYRKILFQLEVSIRFWHDVFMARFVWPEESVLPGASFERELCCLQDFLSMLPQGHLLSHLSKALFVFGEGDVGL